METGIPSLEEGHLEDVIIFIEAPWEPNMFPTVGYDFGDSCWLFYHTPPEMYTSIGSTKEPSKIQCLFSDLVCQVGK